ncbi:hypothetical protein CC99x_004280 [Candidatus Berkiella cookevillensis]|uniref:Uncharacterized protein n=1 Tax=Candidatus Berkiella cookevillensis TaxID=437022 RepID=A0A0Q9YPJ7_9GAMM|nr:hypothetical protein [Candidatus Berkiella cookevillensis]MCS5708116.1 hypothetical protein [Candidatus Berkiella cookevillensis]
MLSFKTVQTALPLATKVQLNNLVTAIRDASKLNPLREIEDLYSTQEFLAVRNILAHQGVNNALKAHASLVAEIMIHAEAHMQHPVVILLADAGGHIEPDNTMKIPFAEEIRLKFAHICLHSPTTDVQINGSREHESYSIRPIEKRTKDKELSSSSSRYPSTQCPEVTGRLTAEELFDFFKAYQTLPVTQSSDQDYLEMILWTIQNRRTKDIATIKNSAFEQVQFANQDKIISLINQTKMEDGQQYVRNFIEKSLKGNEAAFLKFIQQIVAKPLPYNLGCLEESLQHPSTIALLSNNIYTLLDIARSNANLTAATLLEKLESSIISSAPVMTTAYDTSMPRETAIIHPISEASCSSQRMEVPTQSILSPEVAAIVDAYTSKAHKDVVYGLKSEVLHVFNDLNPETVRAFGNISIHTAANVLKFQKMPIDTQIDTLLQMQALVEQQHAKKKMLAKS